MFFDIVDAAALITEAFCGRFAAQALNEGLRRATDDAWEVDLVDTLQDDVVRLHRISGRERRPRHVAARMCCLLLLV